MRNFILLLILAASFAATACDQITASMQVNNQNDSARATPQPSPPKTLEEAKRISLADAKTAFDQKTAIFVDTRDKDSFAQEHIKGALSIPLPDLENRLKELPTDKQIIAYCS